LRRLLDEGYFTPPESTRVERLLREPDADGLAVGTHEFVRRLLRSDRLQVTEGRPAEPTAGLTVSDPRRGLRFVLPALASPEAGVVRLPLDPAFGPPAHFTREESWSLFDRLSHQTLASVDRSADLRATIVGILDAAREFLEVPTALFFGSDLPVPGGIARGPRDLVLGPPPHSAAISGAVLPPTWAHWAERLRSGPEDAAVYLTDHAALAPERRPAAAGSSLWFRLDAAEGPGQAVLAAVAPAALWFDEARVARLRVLAAHFRRLFRYALRLQASISFDALTGIYNRGVFEDQLRRILAGASRQGQGFALLIVDIDDFKAFNQRHGYDAGDEVLRRVAAALKGALRATDVLARYGGEEFAVLLAPALSPVLAGQIAERLRATLEQLEVRVPSLGGEPRPVRVTVSIGAAFFPRDGTDRDRLWGRANRMLLEAKAAGKSRVRCAWEPSAVD
jgi:diguanylate cyclase (GGDEF)-like protein